MSQTLRAYGEKHSLPVYLQENFKTALCVLNILGYDIDLGNFFAQRFARTISKLFSNVTIDVGHNVMVAEALVKSLGKKGYVGL